jgi:hypothetical protein
MALSLDERNATIRKWFWDYLGRPPSAQEQAMRAQQIVDKGLDLTLAAITDSPEAAAYRKRRGL